MKRKHILSSLVAGTVLANWPVIIGAAAILPVVGALLAVWAFGQRTLVIPPGAAQTLPAVGSTARPPVTEPAFALAVAPVAVTNDVMLSVDVVPGGINIHIPEACQVDWSHDLQTWYFWRTYTGPANEQFECLGDALYFRAKAVRP